MNEFKRILVVARMMQTCQVAIKYGASLSRKYGADLYIIHSIYNPFDPKEWGFGTRALAVEYDNSIVDIKRKLAGLVDAEKTKGMAITEIVREGEPTAEILKTIEQENIDLLVMLAHEEGRMEDLFFNRSNDGLVRRMPCSIMLVKKEPGQVLE